MQQRRDSAAFTCVWTLLHTLVCAMDALDAAVSPDLVAGVDAAVVGFRGNCGPCARTRTRHYSAKDVPNEMGGIGSGAR